MFRHSVSLKPLQLLVLTFVIVTTSMSADNLSELIEANPKPPLYELIEVASPIPSVPRVREKLDTRRNGKGKEEKGRVRGGERGRGVREGESSVGP
jgi:hypothetical protein